MQHHENDEGLQSSHQPKAALSDLRCGEDTLQSSHGSQCPCLQAFSSGEVREITEISENNANNETVHVGFGLWCLHVPG